ncbi:DUF2617 family protein, partial [Streptomyces calidiresistens]|uniref:DUF2617 family protein n=1 Tax=Streptomyces calidiresistens TaxID=1485586 RepID=UPI0018883728
VLRPLVTPYADTRSTDLTWSLDRPPLPALASRRLCWADGGPRLELRVLGASHQVLLHRPQGALIETVACAPGPAVPLPAAVARRVDAVGTEDAVDAVDAADYAFSSRVDHLPPAELAARTGEVTALTSDHPHALIGVFPGRPHAVTALIAHRRPDGVEWETWHTYPAEGTVVFTRGRVVTGARATTAGTLPIPAARRPPRGVGAREAEPVPTAAAEPRGAVDGTRPSGDGSGE